MRTGLLFDIIGTDERSLIRNRSRGLRAALISAITACAEERLRKKAQWFLQGLSSDELEYIAEYLGACVLELCGQEACSRRQAADGIAHFDRWRSGSDGSLSDHEHKMIVLLEYLCRCKLTRYSLVTRAGRTS